MGRAMRALPLRWRGMGSSGTGRFDAPAGIQALAHRRAWIAYLAITLSVSLSVGAFGDLEARSTLYAVWAFSMAAAAVVGVALHRPARRAGWLLVAAGSFVITFTTANALDAGSPAQDRFWLLDMLELAGYAAEAVGCGILFRGRIAGGDRAGLLDAAILATGAAIVISSLTVVGRSGTGAGGPEPTGWLLYLFLGTIVAGIAVRTFFVPGQHRPAARLFVVAVLGAMLGSGLDLIVDVTADASLGRVIHIAWMMSFVFIGSAALHPSMAFEARARQDAPRAPGRPRVLGLTAALLVLPATLAVQTVLGIPISPPTFIIGGALLGILVVARLSETLRQLAASLGEREALTEQLREQALHDALTGLPNRRLFESRLADATALRATAAQGGSPLAVLFLDLDDFKAVNDTLGHTAGDALLIEVARRLRGAVRADDVAARLHGDEFAVLVPSCTDPADPARIAERILGALAEPLVYSGRALRVRASIGLAIADDGVDADAVCRNADVAMYLAKSLGKNRYEVFEDGMHNEAVRTAQLRVDLEAAIESDHLVLHYQPIVDLATDAVLGLEALVRWRKADGTLVPPGDFIPLAESSGLIDRLTDWVIGHACREAARWTGPSELPWVTVNVSVDQLRRADFIETTLAALAAADLSADRLVIELTESGLIELDSSRPTLETLRAMGIRIAIDDFGTGYSALSYLARLPIDIVKIDRTFVSAVREGGVEEAITTAIVALAKRFGIVTVAEGIESAAEFERVRALGCDLGQGYFIARPAPPDDIAPPVAAQIRSTSPAA